MSPANTYRREIDACRPGSDDLRLPELAGLAQAVETDSQVAEALAKAHARDIVLCDALQEVPIPSGLADRLLDAVKLSAPRSDVADAAVPAQVAAAEVGAISTSTEEAEPSVALPTRNQRSSRRWFAASIAAVAAAAVLAIAYGTWNRAQPQSFTKAQLARMAEGWYDQALPAAGWAGSVSKKTLTAYPIDPAIRVPARNERTMHLQGAASGVAYDLTPSGKDRAILFVLRTPDRFDVAPIAYTTLRPTGGVAMAAWQKGELLYVLVVDERDRQRLEDFVRKQPLT